MEFDVFIPSLKLALEYHGQQHYSASDLYGDIMVQRRRKDAEKRAICQLNGVTLVEIPYWFDWGASKESLLEIIGKKRPDLLAERLE